VNARLAPALFFGAALVVMLGFALGAPLDHDEHQFIASAALLARDGLLPYRDFAYFHTPNLVGIYALLFLVTDHLLLAARLFSTLCAWLIGIGLFAISLHRASSVALALGIAALFFVNPVVDYTFPKAWNHMLPALLLLLAFASQCRGARLGRAGWFFASGFLVAAAAGTRISFAPLALPFLVMAWFTPGRHRAVAACIVGMFVASIPTFLLLGAAPEQFLFDNLAYNSRVNALYRLASGDERSALLSKTIFVGKVLVNPGNAALLGIGLFAILRRRRQWRSDYPTTLLLAILPFVLVGIFAPTPSYSQYYSVLAVVAALAAALGLRPTARWPLAAIVAVSGTASVVQNFETVTRLAAREWTPLQLHADGRALRMRVDSGRVLTLAPIVPLEGGLDIYPELATGSFAWRTASLIPPAERQRHGFIAPEDLLDRLAARPPTAILLGYERKQERTLLTYARDHGYHRTELRDKITGWLPFTTRGNP
jgi:hypothetical protein